MNGIGQSSRSSGAVARLVAAWRGTSALFVAGVAVIALHVLDDSFLRPRPGVPAGDPLVSGLTPLALLALAVWAFPRLSGGGRGALALTVGAFGLAAGGEATYDTITAVPTGDDYTGLLATCAGLVLLAAGVAMLWRSRRSDGGRRSGSRRCRRPRPARTGCTWTSFRPAATTPCRSSGGSRSSRRRSPRWSRWGDRRATHPARRPHGPGVLRGPARPGGQRVLHQLSGVPTSRSTVVTT